MFFGGNRKVALIPKLAETKTQYACASRTVSPPRWGSRGSHSLGSELVVGDKEQKSKKSILSFCIFVSKQSRGWHQGAQELGSGKAQELGSLSFVDCTAAFFL